MRNGIEPQRVGLLVPLHSLNTLRNCYLNSSPFVPFLVSGADGWI